MTEIADHRFGKSPTLPQKARQGWGTLTFTLVTCDTFGGRLGADRELRIRKWNVRLERTGEFPGKR